MTEPHRYERLPLEVSAFELTQFGDFVRACAWVGANNGTAYFAAQGTGNDYMMLVSQDGLVEVRVGEFVVHSSAGFTRWDAESFHEAHRPIPEPLYDEGLTGTGTYVVGRPDGATAIVGGAALTLPT